MNNRLSIFAAAAFILPSSLLAHEVTMGDCTVAFDVDADGRPVWSMSFDGESVVEPSALGFDTDAGDMTKGWRVAGCEKTDVASSLWHPVWGEESEISDNHRDMLVMLEQAETGRKMNVRFRVFADGAGLRYEFPSQGKKFVHFTIREERTQFNLPCDPACWWIPADYDSQEYRYANSKASEIPALYTALPKGGIMSARPDVPAVQTALMMKYPNGLYVNIHEAACLDYATMHLRVVGERGTGNGERRASFEALLTPNATGAKGYGHIPFNTPWRTVIVGRRGADILASRITLNLNEPCAIADTSWIRPVKYIGVWWEMIISKTRWDYTDDFPPVRIGESDYASAKPHGRHAATTAHVKEYIDFAAKNGFDAVLVEGWNIGWEDWLGTMKEVVFDFVTPYPDFGLAFLRDYAASNGVHLVMHHETSASVGTYERRLDEAYAFMATNGYRVVKSGYAGPIIPAGDHHYSQAMNGHYNRCIKKAAAYRIMVNAHEAVRPTGLCRTWPNMIGNESARGGEFEAFDGNDPEHRAILPFTRLIGGPMDYTPGILETDLRVTSGSKYNRRHISSTLCGQLALYVTMSSPLQMAADTIESYERYNDAFQFIKDVPCDWAKSVYLEAEPGDVVTIARREKGGERWFMGSVAGGKGHDSSVALGFLDDGAIYEAKIYADAQDASFDGNPKAYSIETRTVTSGDTLSLRSAPGGGWAVSLWPVSKSKGNK